MTKQPENKNVFVRAGIDRFDQLQRANENVIAVHNEFNHPEESLTDTEYEGSYDEP